LPHPTWCRTAVLMAVEHTRAALGRLPLVQSDDSQRMWMEPIEIQEAFQKQPAFIRPESKTLWWTVAASLLPSLYFAHSILPRFRDDSEGPSEAMLRFQVSCLAWLSAASALTSLFLAAYRNPGVVPTQLRGAPACVPSRNIVVNGVKISQKYCQTCRIYRPLRSKHCSSCGRCIFRYDHHCPWLGNCIGLGNYRTFLCLISSAMIYFGVAAAVTYKVLKAKYALSVISTTGQPVMRIAALRQVLWGNLLATLFLPACALLSLALGMLVVYHVAMVTANLTTNEHVRGYYDDTGNPFRESCAKNVEQVTCVPFGHPLAELRIGATRHSQAAAPAPAPP